MHEKEDFLRKLGARIRNLRIKKGLRQEDFDDGTKLGITCRGLQGIEYGEKNVKVYTLAMIADRLGVTLPELLDFPPDGDGSSRPKRRSSPRK